MVPRLRKRISALVVAAFIGTATLGAQAAQPAATPPTYKFALTALIDEGVAPEARPFLTRLPLLILAALDNPPPRLEMATHAAEVGERTVLGKRFQAGDVLFRKLDESAALDLDPSIVWFDRLERVKKADDAILDARKALESISATPSVPAAIPDAAVSTIKVVQMPGQGSLFDLGGLPPLLAGRKQSVDLVVSGRVRSVRSYVEVKLEGYDAAIGRKVFEWKSYANPGDPGPLADTFALKLADVLAASPVGRLVIEIDPPDATVLVDGILFEDRPAVMFGFAEKTIYARAWSPGHEIAEGSATITPGSTGKLGLVLKPQAYGSASLKLSPSEAKASIQGKDIADPGAIPLVGIRKIAIVRAQGHESSMTVIPASGTQQLAAQLIRIDGLGPAGRAEKAKDSFYFSLGLVAIGMPLTNFLKGYDTLYADADLRNPGGTFFTQRIVAGAAYWGAALATASCFVNGAFKLAEFVGTVR
jgi:hypothetical protein